MEVVRSVRATYARSSTAAGAWLAAGLRREKSGPIIVKCQERRKHNDVSGCRVRDDDPGSPIDRQPPCRTRMNTAGQRSPDHDLSSSARSVEPRLCSHRMLKPGKNAASLFRSEFAQRS